MALSPYFEVFDEIERSLERCGRAALCQIVRTEGSTPGKAGWKLLVCPDGSISGNLGGGAFEAMVQTEAAARLRESQPRSEVKRYYFTEEAVKGEATGMVCGGMAEVFFEVLVAKPLLVICGGGPVGQAVARNAVLCGFEVLVADDRDTYRQPGLFPDGTFIAEVDRDYSQDFLEPHAQREIFVAVVTRCWQTDLAASSAVLRQRVDRLRYLGIMGSRRKVERIQQELGNQSVDLEGLPVYATRHDTEVRLTISARLSPTGEEIRKRVSVPGQTKDGPVPADIRW